MIAVVAFLPMRSKFTDMAKPNFSVAMYSIPGLDGDQSAGATLALWPNRRPPSQGTGEFQEGDPFFGDEIFRRQVHGDEVPGIVAHIFGFGVAFHQSRRLLMKPVIWVRDSWLV